MYGLATRPPIRNYSSTYHIKRDSIQIFFPHWLWTFPPLFTFVRLRLPRFAQCSVKSIPKSNSKIVYLSLCILTPFSLKAQDFLWLTRRLLIFRATRTQCTQGEENQKQQRQAQKKTSLTLLLLSAADNC